MVADLTTQDVVIAALLGLLTLVAFLGVLYLREKRALLTELNRMHEWEKEMAGVTLPPWNGETFDWPESNLAGYLDTFPRVEEPVPPSTISGPLPMLREPATDDADDVIAWMKERTDWFIAMMNEPLAVA
jgi:hypothetical protein